MRAADRAIRVHQRAKRLASTFAHQNNLPHLPVPQLADTILRFRSTVEPLLPQHEQAGFKSACEAFLASPATQKLQERLLRRAGREVNWLEKLWDSAVYLDANLPTPLHYNFFLRAALPSVASAEEQVLPAVGRAANAEDDLAAGIARCVGAAAVAVRSMLAFRAALYAGALPPSTERGNPIDMNQFARLFGHARVPGHSGDVNVCHGPLPEGMSPHFRTEHRAPSEHIVVTCRGHYYSVNVSDGAGGPASAAVIAERLAAVCTSACALGYASFFVGALTALPRRHWAAVRERLSAAAPVNAASLQEIDSAIWVLNLDFLWRHGSAPEFGRYGALSNGRRAHAGSVLFAPESPHAPALSHELGRLHHERSAAAASEGLLTLESRHFLHGRGDASDRYFDKHQLSVTGDGAMAVLIEHSSCDGGTARRVMRFMSRAAQAAAEAASGNPETAADGAAAYAAEASTPEPAAADDSEIGLPPVSELSVSHAALFELARKALRATDDSIDSIGAGAFGGAATASGTGIPHSQLEAVKQLQWRVPPGLMVEAAAASARYVAETSALRARTLVVEGAGTSSWKSAGLAPDAVLQMALQLTHQRLHGFPAPTYESVSTQRFAHGRTETARSCSAASVAFASSFQWPPRSAEHVQAMRWLLADACKTHVEYVQAAAAGKGVDRHMLGLRAMAAGIPGSAGKDSEAVPLPALFTHPAFELSKHWRLSTSNCGGEGISLFGFGPVERDGYGIGYCLTPDSAVLSVTAWRPEASERAPSALMPVSAASYAAHPDAFADAMHQSLQEIRALLASARDA